MSQSDYNTQDYTYEINKAAAKLALEACLEVSSKTGVPRFVAGAMGPTNRTLSVSPSGGKLSILSIPYFCHFALEYELS